MRSVAILQARMGSERLPGKVLAPLCGASMLARAVERLRGASPVDRVVVATTTLSEDDPIEDYCNGHLGCDVYRGSAENVLERYCLCARAFGADVVIRATGDNPAIDPTVVGEAVRAFTAYGTLDYLFYREGLPLGLGVEVFSAGALECAYGEARDPDCLEHVTPYISRNTHLFNVKREPCAGPDRSDVRLTVDTPEDLRTMRLLYGALGADPLFAWEDAVRFLDDHPECVFNGGVEQKVVSYRGDGDGDVG